MQQTGIAGMAKKVLVTGVLLSGLALTATSTIASELTLTLPRKSVAEYHAPYVAVWLADANDRAVKNIAVWYDVEKKNGKGKKWLKDMRLWWRRGGRDTEMPMDGVSGATRRPGEHKIDLDSQLADVPDGQYMLYVEVARELGGREIANFPVNLPITEGTIQRIEGAQEIKTAVLILE